MRFSLIAISAVLVVCGAYYRIQSQGGGEWLDRTEEGWPILIGLRLMGLATIGIIVAWLCNAALFERVSLHLREALRWVGVAGFACGAAWLFWMFRGLGKNLTDTVVTRRNAKFVERGPYRLIRHPMYTGVLVAGVSMGLALGTWLVPLLTCIVFALFVVRTTTEERYLIERFGETYRDYMRRVGAFFPKVTRSERVKSAANPH